MNLINFMKIKILIVCLILGYCSAQEDDWEEIIDGFHPMKACRTSVSGLLPSKANFVKLEEKLFFGLQMDCLDLKARGIHEISSGFFKKFPTLRVVNLEKNFLNVNEFFKIPELGNIESVNLDDNEKIDNLRIVGTYPKLKHLYLRNLGLKNFDYSFSSTLTHLYLSTNDLSQGSLKIPSTVTHLFLNNNKLTKLPVDQNLKVLSLRGNSFEKIGCTQKSRTSNLCLNKFTNLQRLFLGNNDIFEIESNAFDGITNLLTLDLSSNHIDKLDENCLKKLDGLRSLNLSSNPLTDVPKLCVLVNLEVLILDHTRIIGIGENGFCGLKKLKALWLNDVAIERIATNSFGNLISLEELHLGDNKLSTLDGWQMPFSLRRLYLQGNLFKSLADATRIGTAFLEYLDLRRNQITDSKVRSFNISKLHIDF